MHLRHRIVLIFLALSLLVAADLALDRYLASEREQHRQDVLRRWEPARDATSTVLFGLVDQETAERGFVITGDDEFLEPYREGGERADEAVDRLQRLVGEDNVIAPQLRRTVDRITAWRQLGAEYEIEAKRQGRDEAATDLVATGTSRRLFDEARVELADLRLTIVQRLASEEELVRQVEQRSSALRAMSAMVALATVIFGAQLMRRWLTRPLLALGSAVRTVASGRLDHEIPAVGPPELSSLATDVEAMRRRILSEVDDAARARSSLAQRGIIVLALRDELAPSAVTPPPGLTVATRFRPAESFVAGDWYDLHRIGDHQLVFVLADVSGHGPSAGIFALKTKQLVQVALQQDRSPADAWAWVSEHLGEAEDQFLTGVIGRIDTSTGMLTFASAGHPPLLVHGDTGTLALPPTGPIVGAFEGEWAEQSTPFGPGCSLLAYSDGLLEVQDDHGTWADLAQLEAALRWEKRPSADRMADLALEYHDRHRGREHRDDVTIVAIAAGERVRPG